MTNALFNKRSFLVTELIDNLVRLCSEIHRQYAEKDVKVERRAAYKKVQLGLLHLRPTLDIHPIHTITLAN